MECQELIDLFIEDIKLKRPQDVDNGNFPMNPFLRDSLFHTTCAFLTQAQASRYQIDMSSPYLVFSSVFYAWKEYLQSQLGNLEQVETLSRYKDASVVGLSNHYVRHAATWVLAVGELYKRQD